MSESPLVNPQANINLVPLTNPTHTIDLDFYAYVNQRQGQLSPHLLQGVPDYAFSLDRIIRSKLGAIWPIRMLARSLVAANVPIQKQIYLLKGVAVGPRQFPEIHQMGEDCARTLGIGVPQIFVSFDPYPNGFTMATGEVDQIIVLTTGLIEATTPTELKSVIGHECGHIHNQHVVFNTMWELMMNPAARALLWALSKTGIGGEILSLIKLILSSSLTLIMGRWHRCAEYTCDRAGMICCADVQAALTAEGKLRTGGSKQLEGFNPTEYARQSDRMNKSLLRFLELGYSHPVGSKRVEAMELFAQSDVFLSWRPELRGDQPVLSKTEIDQMIEKFVL